MKIKTSLKIGIIAILGFISSAQAAVLTENFDDPFTDWRSGFMGVNTNLESWYVEVGDPNQLNRGNNEFGIWIANGNGVSTDTNVDIAFNAPFGASLTQLSFSIGSFQTDVTLEFYDSSLNILSSSAVIQNNVTNPTDFYSVSSGTGIGGFRIFSPGQIEGFTNIDTVTANTEVVVNPVPIPATFALIGLGLVGLVWTRRKNA